MARARGAAAEEPGSGEALPSSHVERQDEAVGIIVAFVRDAVRRGQVPDPVPNDDEDEDNEEEGEDEPPAAVLHLSLKRAPDDIIKSFDLEDLEDAQALSEVADDIAATAAEDLLGSDVAKETFVVKFDGGNGRCVFTLKASVAPDDDEAPARAAPAGGTSRAISVRGPRPIARADDEDDDDEDEDEEDAQARYDRERQRATPIVADTMARIVDSMLGQASEAHKVMLELPEAWSGSYKQLVTDQNKRIADLTEEINTLYKERREVLIKRDEIDTHEHEHALALKKEERRAAREKHAWDALKAVVPQIIPFIPQILASRSGLGQVMGAVAAGQGGYAGVVAPPAGMDGGENAQEPAAGEGGGELNMQSAMQLLPLLRTFFADLSYEQIEQVAATSTIHLTPQQVESLLMAAKILRGGDTAS